MKWHEAIKQSKMQIARTELKPYKFCCVNGEMWELIHCTPIKHQKEFRDSVEWYPFNSEDFLPILK